MGLVGRLEDLSLRDIFRLLALSRRTGKLSLSRREGNGVILFREGKIIYAASDSLRDTLGNILVSQNLLNEGELLAALEAQYKSVEVKRLGSILLELGLVTHGTLDQAIHGQIEKVIAEFLAWKTGFFRFELMDIPASEEVEVDAKDFLLEGGVSGDAVIQEASRRLDEMVMEAVAPAPAPGAPPPAGAVAGGSAPAPSPAPQFEALAALKSALAEVRSPSFTGEITLLILRYAEQVMNRGVIFGLRKDGLAGMGQRGVHLDGASPDERVRSLKIPLDAPSVFYEVIETKQPYRGRLERNRWNDYLVERLGGHVPDEVIVFPLTVNGSVVVTFYGDNAPDNAPAPPADGLELLMIQLGLDMERNLLESRIKALERKLGAS